MHSISLEQVNQFDQSTFTTLLGDLFEHSYWIAQATWERRPFVSWTHLVYEMNETFRRAGRECHLQVIRAHPDLADRLPGKAALT